MQMRTRLLARVIVFLLTVQLASPLVFAQNSSALSGVVTDSNGAVIEGATVVVKDEATGTTFTTKTVGNGSFVVPALGNGVYSVGVSAPGFKQIVTSGVKVHAGSPASVRVVLEVGATSESVTVQG